MRALILASAIAAVWLAEVRVPAATPSGWEAAAVVPQRSGAVACDVAAILSGIWAQRTGEVAQWRCERTNNQAPRSSLDHQAWR